MKRFYFLFMLFPVTCSPNQAIDVLAVREDTRWYAKSVSTKDGDAATIDSKEVRHLDVRGVGDSAWTRGGAPGARYPTPLRAGFGAALHKVDPHKKVFSADLAFINWESIIGVRCDNIRQSVSYYFISHPDNIAQAFSHGFNLFGVANNHSQDCNEGRAYDRSLRKHGPLMTADVMQEMAAKHELLWHGTGKKAFQARTRTLPIKGEGVDVAFGNLSLITWDIPNSANININRPGALDTAKTLLKSLQQADADFRILSIHTQDRSGSRGEGNAFRLMKTIAQIFIESYNGNVVYVHGPHTWAGVKVITRADGRRGVVFASTGNFIHQGLSSNPDNYMGRALFDLVTKQLQEVQVIPYRNNGGSVILQNRQVGPNANFRWKKTDQTGPSRFYARF